MYAAFRKWHLFGMKSSSIDIIAQLQHRPNTQINRHTIAILRRILMRVLQKDVALAWSRWQAHNQHAFLLKSILNRFQRRQKFCAWRMYGVHLATNKSISRMYKFCNASLCLRFDRKNRHCKQSYLLTQILCRVIPKHI